MFNSILDSVNAASTATLSVADALLCLGSALLFGLIIALVYLTAADASKSFVVSLILLPALVQIVILMVNGNLGTGIAIVGAFSLVRFRSFPGSAKEITCVFFAMAIGLACGQGYITYAAIFTAIICLVLFLLTKLNLGVAGSKTRQLRILIPENLNYNDVFEDIFQKYTKKVSLEKIKTTNLGSLFELTYVIQMIDPSKEKEMIDELRCRNGNLTICCSKQQAAITEL